MNWNDRVVQRSGELSVSEVGRWCWGIPGCTCGMPMPIVIADAEQRAARAQILSYLAAAPGVDDEPPGATVPCRFATCAFAPLDVQSRSDGVWKWPATMLHYVEVHGLALPETMFAHMRASSFRPPATVGIASSGDFAAWSDFAARMGASPPHIRRGFGSSMLSMRDGRQFVQWEGEDILVDDTVRAELNLSGRATSLSWTLQTLQSQLKRGLTPIGYWAESPETALSWLPHPRGLVDDSAYGPADRARIVAHLKEGSTDEQWRGRSTCRFPPCPSGGSVDLTDGTFVWPEDLSHYVEQHHIRLPARFVTHVLTR